MSWVVTAIVGSTLVSAYGSKKASDAQVDASKDAGEVQLQISRENIAAQNAALDKILATNANTLATQTALNQPWQDAGLAALEYIAKGTADGSLQPLGANLGQRAYVAPTREEIVAAAGGSEDPQAIFEAAKREGYSVSELDKAFGLQPGEANAWINANVGDSADVDRAEIMNLTGGSEKPEDVYRAMQQFGYSAEKIDQAMGLQPGEAAQWIDTNVTQPNRSNLVNSLLGAANSQSTIQPYKFEQYQAPGNLQAGTYTPPEDFSYSGGDFSYEDYTRPEFNFEEDPGYQFRKEEGLNALERVASVRGRLASPAQAKVTERYVQGLAAQEYANAFTRYLQETDRDNNQYNMDRSFAYGGYIDDYNMEFGEYSDDRNFDYGTFIDNEGLKERQRAEGVQQHQTQQNAQYTDYTNRVNLENQRRQNVLNTALQIANMGRGATDSNINAVGTSGNNVMSSISNTTNNNANQNTNGGAATANARINGGNATAAGYQGITQSANQGIENYLLYKMTA